MPVCAVKLCRNYVGKPYNNTKITFHRIPNNPVIKNRWIECIRKSRGEATWKPTKTTVVCSDHFRSKHIYTVKKTGHRRLTKEAVPSKALFLSSIKSSESEDSDDIDIAEISNPNEASGICNDECPRIESPEMLFIISEIDAVPDNDIPDEKINDKTVEIQIKTEADEEKSFSDLDAIYDSPTEEKLRGTMSIMVPNNDIPNEKISDKTVEVQNKTETDDEKSFSSDLDSVYDSPTEAKLRRQLRRKLKLEKKHVLLIKCLRQKNNRLKKKVSSLLEIIGKLKREHYK